MTGARLIVLKFGGSVLRGATSLPAIAAEIRRHCALGHPVVAVVSAMAGRTDALLAECHAAGLAAPFAIAARVALGERECAALLAVELARGGAIAAKEPLVVEPAALQLRAVGPALDADPVAVASGQLHALVQQHGAVVVPGYVAIDASGRTVLLGRGGSDLTALFLAQRLGARCRLIKDVGGLFDRDPAGGRAGPPIARASYAELLALGGRIVQAKAVAFAQAHALSFELAGLGADAATQVGPAEVRDAECG